MNFSFQCTSTQGESSSASNVHWGFIPDIPAIIIIIIIIFNSMILSYAETVVFWQRPALAKS